MPSRPMIVAANKADLLPPDSDNLERLKAHVEAQGLRVLRDLRRHDAGHAASSMKTIAGKLCARSRPSRSTSRSSVKPLAEAGDADELSDRAL
ncbi:MAG: hypothetical protein ACLS3C_08935 [Oscillospiraceae bacterium]